MKKNLIARASVMINAPASKVWAAITSPTILKPLYFGADIITDWKVGSPIFYRGLWEGKPYEDKGTILKFEPEKLLVSTHWSPLSGVPDTLENYHTVSYILTRKKDGTEVTITQDNNASEDEKQHSDQFWQALLDGLKKHIED